MGAFGRKQAEEVMAVRVFSFAARYGRQITQFGSGGVTINGLAHLAGEGQVSFMRLGSGGVIGYHQATVPQLFAVVEGRGWVRGETPERTLVSVGQAAYWDAGEGHESGTDMGMTAIVVEGERLDLSTMLRGESEGWV